MSYSKTMKHSKDNQKISSYLFGSAVVLMLLAAGISLSFIIRGRFSNGEAWFVIAFILISLGEMMFVVRSVTSTASSHTKK